MQITRIQIHQPAGLLRLVADSGEEGLCPGVTPESGRLLLDGPAPALLGADPLDRERLWQVLAALDRSRQTRLRAYVDIALWDLVAKVAGVPLFRFINGFRDRCPACLRGAEDLGPDEVAQQVVQAQEEGFAGYIIAAPLPEGALAALLREARRAAGDEFYLVLDGAQALTMPAAVRLGRVLDEVGAFRFDRPRPDGDLAGARAVAEAIDTPVAVAAYTAQEAAQPFAAEAAEHLLAALPESGGVTDALKIARCAEAFGAQVHLRGAGAAQGFAHLQVLGAVKNAPFFEAVRAGVQCPSPIIRNPVRVEEGLVYLPEGPGLGIELDRDALEEETDSVAECA